MAASPKKLVSQYGFLLMEAVLAIMIVSAGTVAIMRTYATSLAAGTISQQYLEASMLIEQIIAQTLSQQEITAGLTNGSFEYPYEAYSWEQTVEEVYPEFEMTEEEMAEEPVPPGTETEDTAQQAVYLLKKISVKVMWQYRSTDKELLYSTATIRELPQEETEDLKSEF
ncbi:MAG: hypothetical protein C4541_08730 [Candidatus Auribacter fodinae]|jgi:type II secretory pathway pseudopilin PulG|uniref:Type II secretion system protein n=1 Tax=Candidatus Auribacter fodinae TaxID=2093366 RepID=A0A3A4R0E8_9BACT|nr:MAG: hypothetical protein C4541_08730 [Candidatus Auribacter fodinae]